VYVLGLLNLFGKDMYVCDDDDDDDGFEQSICVLCVWVICVMDVFVCERLC
jgi:hypothetical protein